MKLLVKLQNFFKEVEMARNYPNAISKKEIADIAEENWEQGQEILEYFVKIKCFDNCNSDYSYCKNDKCLHRRGCKRALSNYIDIKNAIKFIDFKKCESSLNYEFLDRFRGSDGSEL